MDLVHVRELALLLVFRRVTAVLVKKCDGAFASASERRPALVAFLTWIWGSLARESIYTRVGVSL